MSNLDCCSTQESDCNVKVSVDVTNIVKYLCIAGVLIIGIIFSSKHLNRDRGPASLFQKD